MTDREAFEAWYEVQGNGSSYGTQWHAWQAALASERAKRPTASEQFNKYGPRSDEETDPVERLRAFCSYAMQGQDWLDVEQFFDDVLADQAKQAEPVAIYDGVGFITPHGDPVPIGPLYATPPDDEAVRLLREAHDKLGDSTHKDAENLSAGQCPACQLMYAIDAYLARVGK